MIKNSILLTNKPKNNNTKREEIEIIDKYNIKKPQNQKQNDHLSTYIQKKRKFI